MLSDEVKSWRRAERKRLLDLRMALTSSERARLVPPILGHLGTLLEGLTFCSVGIYWPIRREIDVRPLLDGLARRRGFDLALPVVVEPASPLEFWKWRLGEETRPGVWNIPVPSQRDVVRPQVVIAPLVGFHAGYRLGYGGGYFDRTLGTPHPRPVAIGVGFEFSNLEAFAPQPHDIPMDAIVTEQGIRMGAAPVILNAKQD